MSDFTSWQSFIEWGLTAVQPTSLGEPHCGICYYTYNSSRCSWEDPSPEIPVKLACGHIFGVRCISRWTAANSTCPFCRYELFRSSLQPFGYGFHPFGAEDELVEQHFTHMEEEELWSDPTSHPGNQEDYQWFPEDSYRPNSDGFGSWGQIYSDTINPRDMHLQQPSDMDMQEDDFLPPGVAYPHHSENLYDWEQINYQITGIDIKETLSAPTPPPDFYMELDPFWPLEASYTSHQERCQNLDDTYYRTANINLGDMQPNMDGIPFPVQQSLDRHSCDIEMEVDTYCEHQHDVELHVDSWNEIDWGHGIHPRSNSKWRDQISSFNHRDSRPRKRKRGFSQEFVHMRGLLHDSSHMQDEHLFDAWITQADTAMQELVHQHGQWMSEFACEAESYRGDDYSPMDPDLC
ncbi:hypothetical protein BCR34DRAFT_605140 [Clohesyomyces aquaticus]|uniref:RING-type domain-containing protein n=1 Tax=Clohesyomyces aquaticus TaxID=1231657 RepID=A0A1Y1Z127_9PLEO|nr:hypothetical protein BCR34DRAFT_605140 [Clohesyomyces aquaticus]